MLKKIIEERKRELEILEINRKNKERESRELFLKAESEKIKPIAFKLFSEILGISNDNCDIKQLEGENYNLFKIDNEFIIGLWLFSDGEIRTDSIFLFFPFPCGCGRYALVDPYNKNGIKDIDDLISQIDYYVYKDKMLLYKHKKESEPYYFCGC